MVQFSSFWRLKIHCSLQENLDQVISPGDRNICSHDTNLSSHQNFLNICDCAGRAFCQHTAITASEMVKEFIKTQEEGLMPSI